MNGKMEAVKAVKFEDPDGKIMPMFAVGDVMIPPVPGMDQNFHKLKDFKIRDDDIILTTYPRSGTHFMWEIIRMLRQGSPEYIKGEKEAEFLEVFFLNGLEEKSDRVVNTHLPPELLPPDFRNRKCKLIHVYRNPKDVLVSLYNHWMNTEEFFGYDGSFSVFFELAMKGQVESGRWSDYEIKYEKFFESNPDIPALIVSYENLKEDPVKNIKKVSDFLGLSRENKLINDIADAVSFSKMKAGKFDLHTAVCKDHMTNEVANRMYRKGEVGDWKNWFTVAQNERFDADFNERMKNCSLMSKIKFTL